MGKCKSEMFSSLMKLVRISDKIHLMTILIQNIVGVITDEYFLFIYLYINVCVKFPMIIC